MFTLFRNRYVSGPGLFNAPRLLLAVVLHISAVWLVVEGESSSLPPLSLSLFLFPSLSSATAAAAGRAAGRNVPAS